MAKAPIKTTHEEIKDYWELLIDEQDIGTDWKEALNHCWCCGEEIHNRGSLHRCHIIPASMGGKDEPSNFVLLCSGCHEDSPDINDPAIMWDWLKRVSSTIYGEMKFRRVVNEYSFIFKETPKLHMEIIPIYNRIMIDKATAHFNRVSLSTQAYVLRLAIESFDETLNKNNSEVLDGLARVNTNINGNIISRGIQRAKANGQQFGRSLILTNNQVEEIFNRVQAGEQKKALAKEFGISRQTLYSALDRYKNEVK